MEQQHGTAATILNHNFTNLEIVRYKYSCSGKVIVILETYRVKPLTLFYLTDGSWRTEQ